MTVKLIKSLEELTYLIDHAKGDGHGLVYPNHVVSKEGVAIGAISTIPTFLVWLDTKQARVRDSLEVEKFLENYVSANGGNAMCMPCMKSSPFHPLMEKVGFVNLGDYSLFVKGL